MGTFVVRVTNTGPVGFILSLFVLGPSQLRASCSGPAQGCVGRFVPTPVELIGEDGRQRVERGERCRCGRSVRSHHGREDCSSVRTAVCVSA